MIEVFGEGADLEQHGWIM